MRILPVMDLLRGEVVHGVGGDRATYRPLRSRLAASSRPLDVAAALRSTFGGNELYLADLDALAGNEPAWSIFAALREQGFRLWVDAGVREVTQSCQLAHAGIESIVAGLETVAGPAALGEMARAFGTRLVFSLDLRAGVPLGEGSAWPRSEAWSIAVEAIAQGVKRVLVLDLARVGRGAGTGTAALCVKLHETYPELEISAGGGVRDRADLEELRAGGVSAALVASALHDGRLTPADLEGL